MKGVFFEVSPEKKRKIVIAMAILDVPWSRLGNVLCDVLIRYVDKAHTPQDAACVNHLLKEVKKVETDNKE